MRYQRVSHEQELLSELAQPGASILCGGTDILVKLRAGLVHPTTLLDVSRIASMQGIRAEDGYLLIGAATRESEIVHSALVQEQAPVLVEVLKQLGSVQIRNQGSLGGNVVNASPAADSAIPLLLHEAELQVVEAQGEDWIPLESFFTGPGQTTLQPAQFIRCLRLRPVGDHWARFFHKVGKRNALTIAIASLGLLADVQDGTLQTIRIAVGSVAPTPRRLRDIEAQLSGQTLSPDSCNHARNLIMSTISPISDVRASADYRRRVIGELLHKALVSLI